MQRKIWNAYKKKRTSAWLKKFTQTRGKILTRIKILAFTTDVLKGSSPCDAQVESLECVLRAIEPVKNTVEN